MSMMTTKSRLKIHGDEDYEYLRHQTFQKMRISTLFQPIREIKIISKAYNYCDDTLIIVGNGWYSK